MEEQLLLATTVRAGTMPSLEYECTRGLLAGLEYSEKFSAYRFAEACDTDRPGTLPHFLNHLVTNQQHLDTYAFP